MDEQDQYSTRATSSGKSSGNGGLPATMSPAQTDLNRSEWIAKMAQRVLSSYRRDGFADPEGFVLQLGMVLERYPDGIIEEVTHPAKNGIQRACKWPPSIAEVIEFCDEIQRRATRGERWNKQSQEQLADRAAFELSKEQKPGRTFEQCIAELKAAGLFPGAARTAQPKKFAPGTIVDWRDFDAATDARAHGRLLGPHEVGRKIPYRG